MEGQSQAPEQGPDVVPVGVVGQLMGQHMAQSVGVFRRPRGHVDGGLEYPEQAGGTQVRRRVDGDGGLCPLQRFPPLSQSAIEAQIGGQYHQRRQSRASDPDNDQHFQGGHHKKVVGNALPVIDHAAGVVFPVGLAVERAGVLRRLHWQHLVSGAALCGDGIQHGIIQPGRHILGQIGGQHRQSVAGGGQLDLEGHQQPQEDHPPQGVSQPGGQLIPEEIPRRQHDQNQGAGGDRPLDHQLHINHPLNQLHHSSPSSAFRKISYSSSISALDRA